MPKSLLSVMNLVGILLVAIGVFVFANTLSGKSFIIGSFKFPGGSDAAMFLIALGLILFAASFFAGKIFRKKS
ncbi:MAG: hypothetical protein ABI954_14925 [Pyrinomonadaceae bacterium]